MTDKKYPSDNKDRFIVRLPDGMKPLISTAAKESGRSMNAEIVHRLEVSLMEYKYQKHLETQGITPEMEKGIVETLDRAWPAKKVIPFPMSERSDDLDAEISKLSLEKREALLALLKSFN